MLDIKELKRLHGECPAWEAIAPGFVGSDTTPFIQSAARDGFRLPTSAETVLAFHLRNALPELLEHMENTEAEHDAALEELDAVKEAMPEDSPFRGVETGCSLVDDIRDLVAYRDRHYKSEAQVAALREALEHCAESTELLMGQHNCPTESSSPGSDNLLVGFGGLREARKALTDTASAAEAHEQRIRTAARREVLEDLLTLCNRRATEAAAEGRKFSLDIHQGYEGWAEAQLAALDAPDNTNCVTKAANIPVSD